MVGNAETQAPLKSARWCDVCCRIAAFSVWAALVAFFIGLAMNKGLMIPDDASHAVIAKCMASGIGYASTAPSLDREPSAPLRFDPGVGTGPGILLPCAAVLRIAGINDVLPGISAILVWASVMTVVLVLAGREVRGVSFLLGTTVFCVASFLVFAKQWILWHSLLGEIPAAAYLLMGHWLLADERFSRRSCIIAGLFFGLAVQTKYLAALLFTGAVVILVIRLCTTQQDWRARVTRVMLFLLGCITPTALWETYKLSCLGYHSYIVNWQQFLAATSALTVEGPKPFSLSLVQQRAAEFRDNFSIDLGLWITTLIVVLIVVRKNLAQRWPCLFAGLLTSSVCAFLYWTGFSMGWPRYTAMGVVLGCFALSVPIFSMPRVSQQALFALIVALLVSPAIYRTLPASWARDVQERVPFPPTKARQARAHVVAAIEALQRQGPIDLVCRSPAAFYHVDFDLAGCANFNRALDKDPSPDSPGAPRRRIALINYQWGPHCFTFFNGSEREKIELLLRERIVSVLFSEDPYELVETSGPPPAAAATSQKPPGAFISATPNPAPAGGGFGATVIAWDTGDSTSGEVVQATRDTPEQRLSLGARGEFKVYWLTAGTAYEYRLYAGTERKKLLDSVRVTRNCQ
jgi:hypothetical protein